MQELTRSKKAQNIRSVIRYIQKFKNAVTVIYLDDEIIDSPMFSSHMRDIALIHQAGLKVILVPASRTRIDQVLTASNVPWSYNNNIRITSESAIPLIKMATFDISNIVMTSLAAHQITATIGNWVRARAKGVLDGVDYGTAGEIDKIQTDAIKATLENGFIPIFPCIGWSSVGKPYNISSVTLAKQLAIELKADKLFFVMNNSGITKQNFSIPENVGLSDEGEVPALNLNELNHFLELNKNSEQTKIINLLKTAQEACTNGVSRVHIVNGTYDGALPCEIFSDLGSGTMIYSQNYGTLRPMLNQDIPAVLTVMRPFIEKKILLPRTDESLALNLQDYIVYEIDGGIRACSALHIYPDGQAEIAGVAVDESFSNLGIGPKMIDFLLDRARSHLLKSVFVLTTQTSDWFEKIGFKADSVDSLPPERKAKWTPERGSKVLRITF
ncbi:MAG: amino-acid N-acetyltransferase [Treponema sp.]|nr:amino-acid N-acetyltransferase [Treponema sp.]